MKSLRGASFLLLGTVVFYLFAYIVVIDAHQMTPDLALRMYHPNSTEIIKKFCVPKNGIDDGRLQKNLDWACGQGIDCGPIQPGAVCSEPVTVKSRAAFAMNSYYRTRGETDSACDFSGTGQTTTINPSYGNCIYL